jgi:arylsulfatase A-like enzyme
MRLIRELVILGGLFLAACGGDHAHESPLAVPVRPNVLFYVIDGGGADLMSLYGYERPTTPNIEALAREGVVFEQAHTSSGWTKPSTASFMTSLHHSVLGGFTTNEDRIPDDVVTMAEHFQTAGYRTAVFTTNPFAGSMSGLESGVEHFRDEGTKGSTPSSVELHADFWNWREQTPETPWWAHIQTTDVHEPHRPVEPFTGRYLDAERRAQFEGWWEALKGVKGVERDTVLARYQAQLAELDVAPKDFFRAQWDLYDETMAQNDATIGALVADLKARGEWENTLLILSADHGHPAGSFSRFGRGLIEPQPVEWEGALADSYRTWVPLVVVWPGHLPAGERVAEPVSLLDVLPTTLELADLPPATVQQGQSLVPLLYRQGDWAHRPIVLEQVQAHKETGLMVGHIELIDGRWGASLEVMPPELEAVYRSTTSLETAGGWRAARPHRPSTPPLLLYDLKTDPHCLTNVNAEHPEKVARYTEQLRALWSANQALAKRFDRAEPSVVGDEQIEALRTLGYVE